VLLDDALAVRETWIEGVGESPPLASAARV
jgi:hypothetical protein